MTDEPAEVGPWAEEKLAALRRYLDYYRKVLKNRHWRTIYFDGFAGGGSARIRATKLEAADPHTIPLLTDEVDLEPEQQRLIDGSPRVALNIPNRFHRYVFVEPNPVRCAQLHAVRADDADPTSIIIRNETVAEAIDWMLAQNIAKRTHRGVAFLDPFGANLEWASVEKLARTGLFEVIVNFTSHMAINRMIPRDGDINPSWRARLDRVFGTTEWFDEAYVPRRPNLFTAEPAGFEKRPDATERLLNFYLRKLEQAFGHVAPPRLIRNTRGAPLYYLLWAGPHEKGLVGAKYVLEMGEVT